MRKSKIIVSAFYCAPGKGSEPGVGWNTARLLALHHKVWVVTDARHRATIEEELRENPVDNLCFVYFRLPAWLPVGENLYHYLWQLMVFRIFWRMHRAVRFDFAHHVTLVRYWSPSLLCLLPIPFVWGPVGGGELIPAVIGRDLPLRSRLKERVKRVVLFLAHRDPLVRLTARQTSLALANTPFTAEKIRRLGGRNVVVMAESGLDAVALAAPRARTARSGPTRFASMTRLIYWKGVDLGLEAFARMSDKSAEYWVIGQGKEELRLKRLCRRLGIAERVRFFGDLPREDWLRMLRECDVLVHPCLCNSGGMISLEGMAAGIPVICLDTGGITLQISHETGFRVPVRSREETVRDIARSMTLLASDPALRHKLGMAGRERAETLFDWSRRTQILNLFYSRLQSGANAARDEPAFAPAEVMESVGAASNR